MTYLTATFHSKERRSSTENLGETLVEDFTGTRCRGWNGDGSDASGVPAGSDLKVDPTSSAIGH